MRLDPVYRQAEAARYAKWIAKPENKEKVKAAKQKSRQGKKFEMAVGAVLRLGSDE